MEALVTSLDLLHEALDRRFSDNARVPVLLVGSGLHHHLADHGVCSSPDAGASLRRWNDLLRAARLSNGVAEFSVEHHDDATATWESMLASRAELEPTKLTSEHEDILLGRVKRIIEGATPKREAQPNLVRFGRALRQAQFRDIVTLNFDRTIDRSMTVRGNYTGRVERRAGPGVRRESYRSQLHVRFPETRIWHAHGMAGSARANSIQLGLVAYAAAASEVRVRVGEYRKRQKAWRIARHSGALPETWTKEEAQDWYAEARSLSSPEACWIDQAMTGDLVVLGCGLDRAEIDLWLLLHERQRQFARIPKEARPRSFFLHPEADSIAHIRSGPAGLLPVRTDSHDHAWELVLTKWWT
jgi:hypothetical protein